MWRVFRARLRIIGPRKGYGGEVRSRRAKCFSLRLSLGLPSSLALSISTGVLRISYCFFRRLRRVSKGSLQCRGYMVSSSVRIKPIL